MIYTAACRGIAIARLSAKEPVLWPPLVATVRTGCRRDAQSRGYKGERLTRVRRPQNRARRRITASSRGMTIARRSAKEAALRPLYGLRSPPGDAEAADEMHGCGDTGGGAWSGPEGRRKERAAESPLLAAEWPLRGVPQKRPVCGLSSPPLVAQAASEMHRREGYVEGSA